MKTPLDWGTVSVKLAIVLLLAIFQGVHGDGCPVFGTNQSTTLSRSTRDRLFMNFESPSQCRGNVTGWRFCYYKSDLAETEINAVFTAIFIVFRRESPTSHNYIPVSQNNKVIELDYNFIANSPDFVCMKENLEPDEYIEIQENDIIGACIKRGYSVAPLLVVGTSSGINVSTYQFDRDWVRYCTIPSVNTNNQYFKPRRTSALHLYADVVVTATCRAGDNPPPSVALVSGLSGTYLNTQYPVTCGNHITKWHYCYHTEAAIPRSRLSMTVAVWSLDTATNTYIVSPSSTRTITLRPIQTLAKIFCVGEFLSETEYVMLSPGDVIGVVLPSSNAIPIVSSNVSSEKYIMKHPQSEYPLNMTQLKLSPNCAIALHLYATIENTEDIVATDALMTSKTEFSSLIRSTSYTIETKEQNDSEGSIIETKGQNDSQRSLSGGVISAIIVFILLFLGVVTLVAVSMVCIRQRSRGKLLQVQSGIDNIVYNVPEGASDTGPSSNYEAVTDPYVIYTECSTDIYSSPIDSTYAYQMELDNIKKGNIPGWQENIYSEPADNEEDIYSFLKDRKITNIPADKIVVGGVLGSGQFGTVHQGEWKETRKEVIEVALKSLKNNASGTDKVKFLQEAATMAQFRHSNVVALCGVTDKDGTTVIVVELLSKGDLHRYLHILKPDPGELIESHTPNLLLQFSQQICLGMNYLSNTGFVHRDLAARNILLSSTLICKIADFGMSRDLHEGDYYTSSGGMIPVKWTAPEALHYKKYSTASDVWSYGCVLFEIWSLGHKPFEERANAEVLRILDTGNRMAPPPGCPRRIYEIMIMCWAPNTRQRPGFRDVLLSMLENETVVLHIPPDVTDSHPQAATLGAPLRAGYKIYTDLQKTYI